MSITSLESVLNNKTFGSQEKATLRNELIANHQHATTKGKKVNMYYTVFKKILKKFPEEIATFYQRETSRSVKTSLISLVDNLEQRMLLETEKDANQNNFEAKDIFFSSNINRWNEKIKKIKKEFPIDKNYNEKECGNIMTTIANTWLAIKSENRQAEKRLSYTNAFLKSQNNLDNTIAYMNTFYNNKLVHGARKGDIEQYKKLYIYITFHLASDYESLDKFTKLVKEK